MGEDNLLVNLVIFVGFESDLGVVFNKGCVGVVVGLNVIC